MSEFSIQMLLDLIDHVFRHISAILRLINKVW